VETDLHQQLAAVGIAEDPHRLAQRMVEFELHQRRFEAARSDQLQDPETLEQQLDPDPRKVAQEPGLVGDPGEEPDQVVLGKIPASPFLRLGEVSRVERRLDLPKTEQGQLLVAGRLDRGTGEQPR
jgi:hypothetical protein